MLAVAVAGYFVCRPVVRERPKKFDVYLERIEVKDADTSRWNMNDGYLDMLDVAFFEEKTIFALYLQDGLRVSHDGGRA